MGIKIDYEKFYNCYEQAMQIMGNLFVNLNNMVEIEQAICHSMAIQSASVTALKNYIRDVQWTGFLNIIINSHAEVKRLMSSYIVGLQNLDASINAVIDEDYLTALENRLKELDDEIYAFTEEIRIKAESVEHITQVSQKSSENISTGICAMARDVARLRDDFIEYEEEKFKEAEEYNEVMNEMIRTGLQYLQDRPKMLSYSRTRGGFDGIVQIAGRCEQYYKIVDYSQEQVKQDAQKMQELLIEYKNTKKAEECMKYTANTVIAAASLLLPMGTGYGIAVFAASKIMTAFSVYYNLDQALASYDAEILARTWNTEREAEGLTNFEEGSAEELVYHMAGNLATTYTMDSFQVYALGEIKLLAEYDIDLDSFSKVPSVNEIDHLNEKQIRYVLNNSRNYQQSKIVMLGCSGNYDKIADDKMFCHFKMDNELWETLEFVLNNNYDEIWRLNQRYLEEQIQNNRFIWLSDDPYKGYYFEDGSRRFFQREIDFLKSLGFTFEKLDDKWWKAVRK